MFIFLLLLFSLHISLFSAVISSVGGSGFRGERVLKTDTNTPRRCRTRPAKLTSPPRGCRNEYLTGLTHTHMHTSYTLTHFLCRSCSSCFVEEGQIELLLRPNRSNLVTFSRSFLTSPISLHRLLPFVTSDCVSISTNRTHLVSSSEPNEALRQLRLKLVQMEARRSLISGGWS